MELIEFSPAMITPQARTYGPSVWLTRSGRITITQQAVNLMDLKEGDEVKVFRDAKNEEVWYMEKVKKDGFRLKHQAGSKALTFQNALIVRAIFNTTEYTRQSGYLPIEKVIHRDKTLYKLEAIKLHKPI